MSTTQSSDEPQVSPASESAVEFIDYHTTRDDSPTEAEEKAARETNLALGNAASIGTAEERDKLQGGRFKRLDKHNRDNYWGYRDDVSVSASADKQFKRKALLAFAHQLSLSPLQRQIAHDRLLELDLPRTGERMELVAFCVCAVVFNEDVEGYFGKEKPYYPTREPANNHSAFAALQAKLIKRWPRITEDRILSVYQKVRQGSLPTGNGTVVEESAIGGDETQRRPSYAPEWAKPRSSDTPI